MTDNTESPQKNPLSSSSSNPSGTQALSVSIEEDVREQRAEDSIEPSSESEAAHKERHDAHTADNENDPAFERLETDEAITPADLSDSAGTENTDLSSGDASDNAQAGDDVADLTPDYGEAEGSAPAPDVQDNAAELETDASSIPADEPVDAVHAFRETAQMASALEPSEPENAADELRSEVNESSCGEIRVETNGLMTGEPTTEELREAVRNTLADRGAENEKAFALFNQMSHDLRAAMEDARDDAARVSFKLMEFAQASFQNHVELARDYTAVKNVPDLFNVQSSYIQRQLELLNRKTQELQTLTNEITSKKAEKLHHRLRTD